MKNDLCLKTDRRSGEAAKRALARAGILDRSRRIALEGDCLLLPITAEPQGETLDSLSGSGAFEILHSALPRPQAARSSLRDLLEGGLPQGLMGMLPKSYDVLGTLILLEPLPDALAPYLQRIGEALLALNRGARTVLLKTGKVDGVFRVPSYALVAGEDRRDTVSTEYGVRLRVDVSKAYYSPRLGCERDRVASLVGDGETVVDMFAGVGPFSILIARRRRAKVYSIDINPDAIALLRENMALNKLRGEVVPILGDAAEAAAPLAGVADRVIMNLPKSSLAVLDSALRVLKACGGTIHLYVFASGEPVRGALVLLEGRAYPPGVSCSVERVRTVKEVAPKEYQVALDLRITKNCAQKM